MKLLTHAWSLFAGGRPPSVSLWSGIPYLDMEDCWTARRLCEVNNIHTQRPPVVFIVEGFISSRPAPMTRYTWSEHEKQREVQRNQMITATETFLNKYPFVLP